MSGDPATSLVEAFRGSGLADSSLTFAGRTSGFTPLEMYRGSRKTR